jgi:hypothetical protein
MNGYLMEHIQRINRHTQMKSLGMYRFKVMSSRDLGEYNGLGLIC